MSALVYVDLIQVTPLTFEKWTDRGNGRGYEDPQARWQEYRDRFQPWRWVALSGDNQKRLAKSSERYFNRADALKAIALLFKASTTVYMRQAERGNVVLRMAA